MFNFFEKTDNDLASDVFNELNWDPRVTHSEIKVMAHDGVVTLQGSVPHYFEKIKAEKAAQRVRGVRAVADEIEVSLALTEGKSDEDIANAAINALSWNYAVPENVKISVDRGWITLRGEADWEYQRGVTQNTVYQIRGVRGVTNHMTLSNRESAHGHSPSD